MTVFGWVFAGVAAFAAGFGYFRWAFRQPVTIPGKPVLRLTLPPRLARFLVAAGARQAPPRGEPRGQQPPAPPPVTDQTLIVPPCGCVNSFVRVSVIRCPGHAAAHAARERAAADRWAAEWNRKL